VWAALLAEPKIARATHNMYAYRLIAPGTGVLQADNDDDGEDAAGSNLAHLLAVRKVDNVFVMVSRWYGGIPLGPARFKHILAAARQAIDLLPST
jgi:putative IMPACT (imprinted ancient) family translation regulator